MKCNPWRWLWGIPLLAMWFWITFISERPPIEADLAQRTQNALEQSELGWAQVRFEGRDGVLRGRAGTQDDRRKAFRIVSDVWGVRTLKDETTLLKSVVRFVWSAEYENNKIVLTGFVPTQQAREDVLKAVKGRFPEADIEDRLKLARGGIKIEPWLEGISFGLAQLSDLVRGKLEFIDMDFSLAGLAPSYAVYKDVRSALSSHAPKGVQLAKQDVTPPRVSPYTWRAKRTPTQLVISGFVPGEKERTQLFEYVKKRFPKLAIIDRMETAAGAVPGCGQATGLLVDQLALLEVGEAEMKDATLGLKGRAPSKDIADQVQRAAREDVPESFKMETDLTFPKPKPPRITPFVTSIDAIKSRVRLYGYVPNENERTKLIQVVRSRFPDRTIIDDLKLGSGEPQSWHACLVAGLSGIEKLDAGVVRLSGQKVSVTGETSDEAVAENLEGDVRAAANRACESSVSVKLNLPPEPYLNWSAVYNGDGKVLLDGEIPSRETGSALKRAASTYFPEKDIIDNMKLVQGFDKNWRDVAQTGILLLSKLRKGRAKLSGQELVLAGEARDTAVASAVKGQLKTSLKRGYTGRAKISVRSDAMIWAEKEAKRKAAEGAAAQEATRLKEDREAVRLEAERLEASRLRAAENARARSEELRLKAEENKHRATEEVLSGKGSQQHDLHKEKQVKRRKEADKCQNAMRLIARSGVIRFKFGRADLDRKSYVTLDKIAKQARQCSSFAIVVSGHTDSVGAKHRNMALSVRRAQSVVDYLVKAGVQRSRLKSVGYGELEPLAPNDNEANRAKNRRIEFDVQ